MGLGLDSNFVSSTAWYEYNPTSNSWIQKAPLPAAGRWDGFSFATDSFGYVISGSTNNGYTPQVWQYNPYNNTWTQKSNFPGSARQGLRGFVIGSKAFIGCGRDATTFVLDDFYEYDIVNDSWSQKANVPGGGRNHPTSFEINGKGYLGLGDSTDGLNYHTDFYEYNSSNDTWIQKADYLYRVQATTVYHSGTAGYLLGGVNYNYHGLRHNQFNLLYKYTPTNNTWTFDATFPGLPRGFAGGFQIGQDLYYGLG
ncbi:MAG: hypothetical protein V4615_15885, partial [Bacteroidota bacterium]